MPDLDKLLDNALPQIKQFHALGPTPDQTHVNAAVVAMAPLLAALIMLRQNHPDDTP